MHELREVLDREDVRVVAEEDGRQLAVAVERDELTRRTVPSGIGRTSRRRRAAPTLMPPNQMSSERKWDRLWLG